MLLATVLQTALIPLNPCAARYNSWLLNKLAPNGVAFSFFFAVFSFLSDCMCTSAAAQQALDQGRHTPWRSWGRPEKP